MPETIQRPIFDRLKRFGEGFSGGSSLVSDNVSLSLAGKREERGDWQCNPSLATGTVMLVFGGCNFALARTTQIMHTGMA